MADIITYPENGITYDADDASGYLATRLSGVYSAEEDFAVTAQGGLSVQVSAGQAWVRPARFKGRSIIMEQPTTVVLTEADPVRSRIDRIVLRYDAAAKKTSLQVLDGTPDSAAPAAPEISRTELVYDLCLAEIRRPAGSTSVTAADITDTRAGRSHLRRHAGRREWNPHRPAAGAGKGHAGQPAGRGGQQEFLYPCRGGRTAEKRESFSRGQHLPEHRPHQPRRTVRRQLGGDRVRAGADGCIQHPRGRHHCEGRSAEHHGLILWCGEHSIPKFI